MFNTTDGKKKYFKFNIIGDGSRFKILTNILKIDEDISNNDNKKLFFVKDYDYTNILPYRYYKDGKIVFRKEIPNCNSLLVLLKLSLAEQYEYQTYIGDFRITSIDPINNATNVNLNKVITINTNRAFDDSDLIEGKVWLQLAYDDFTIDTDNSLYSIDQQINPLWRTDTIYIEA